VARCSNLCGVCRLSRNRQPECEHEKPFQKTGYYIAKTAAEVRQIVSAEKRRKKTSLAVAKGRREMWIASD
jgi:hypothetical protein